MLLGAAIIPLVYSLVFARDSGSISAKRSLTVQASVTSQVDNASRLEKLRQQLGSTDAELRRDALLQLGLIRQKESARIAVQALNDPVAIVQVAAAHAIVALPGDEAVRLLTPLLSSRDEFVRREIVFSIGETKSKSATGSLLTLLAQDKMPSVRAAAAIAIGQIRDASAVTELTRVLSDRVREKDDFVRRAVVTALGQLNSRESVPSLLVVLADDKTTPDVRREAARTLGLIGDESCLSALRAATALTDPYLAEAAFLSIGMIQKKDAGKPK